MRYMTGDICSFAFDDINSACGDTTDRSVKRISKELYNIHDDFSDRPISVHPEDWELLLRVCAFLSTDLDMEAVSAKSAWPFLDEDEWRANQHLLDENQIPTYDPAIHRRQVHPWWDRIPSSVGFAILVCTVVAVLIALISL